MSIRHRSSRIRRLSSRFLYEYLSWLDKHGEVTLMNFGYADLDANTEPIALAKKDEMNRYCLQLYHHIAGAIDLSKLDVLEVGSGRGGGTAYVKRYLGPQSMVGIDISSNAIAFSQQQHVMEGLRYLHGDAEDMPLEDGMFDVAINVESSHNYGDMAKFLGEVHRVLRPEGHLLWADIIRPSNYEPLFADIQRSGFKIIKKEDISANVLEAMTLQGERNKSIVARIVPWYARKTLHNFSGVEGAYGHTSLLTGSREYLHLVLRKI